MENSNRNFLMSFLIAAFVHAAVLYYFTTTLERGTTEIPFRQVNIELGAGKVRISNEPKPKEEVPIISEIPEVKEGFAEEVKTENEILEQAKTEELKEIQAKPDESSASGAKTESKNENIVKSEAVTNLQRNEEKTIEESEEEIIEAQQTELEEISETEQQEIVVRYEQLISLWMDKHKEYPIEARKTNITGEAVIRIQINRAGEILNYGFERRTGSKELDSAILRMVESASPVPKVPENYPEGDIIDFLIPIRFSLD